jgi:hypothetical protein
VFPAGWSLARLEFQVLFRAMLSYQLATFAFGLWLASVLHGETSTNVVLFMVLITEAIMTIVFSAISTMTIIETAAKGSSSVAMPSDPCGSMSYLNVVTVPLYVPYVCVYACGGLSR